MSAVIIDHPDRHTVRPDMAYVFQRLDECLNATALFDTPATGLQIANLLKGNIAIPDDERQRRIVTAWALSAFALLQLLGFPRSDLEDVEMPPTG